MRSGFNGFASLEEAADAISGLSAAPQASGQHRGTRKNLLAA